MFLTFERHFETLIAFSQESRTGIERTLDPGIDNVVGIYPTYFDAKPVPKLTQISGKIMNLTIEYEKIWLLG